MSKAQGKFDFSVHHPFKNVTKDFYFKIFCSFELCSSTKSWSNASCFHKKY